jgi:tetratricopeptide (TPR) repeat protein
MPILETIENIFVKKGVSALVKMSIDKFDISKTKQGKLKLLISELKNEIVFEEEVENTSVGTTYTKANIDNYYKLAQTYRKQSFFEDSLTGVAFDYEKLSVKEIEKRLDTLDEEKSKGIIYGYLADFYLEIDAEKSDHYNLLALEHKQELTSIQKAIIYERQALSELFHDEAKKALINVENAIALEPFNNTFKMTKIKILLKLNKLDDLFNKIYELIDEFKRLNDPIQLADAQILLAQYWIKKEDESEALTAFSKAHELLETSSKSALDLKKGYILTHISLLEGDEPKATDALILNHSSKKMALHRLDLIEISNSLKEKESRFYDKGKYNKAIEYSEKALKIQLSIFGEKHPNTAVSYNNIGSAWEAKGEHDKAIEYHEKSLKIQLSTFGENHPNTAISYGNIGLAWDSKGKYNKAIGYYEKALKIQLYTLGENHPSTATSYNNIGGAWKSKGEYDKAIEYHEKSLKINLSIFGENHPNTAPSYNNLGMAWESKGEHDKAIEYHEKSLKIQLSTFGENHPSTATSYNNIGSAWKSKGEYDKAIEYYEKALKILRKVFPNGHPKIDITTKSLKSAKESLGKRNQN